NSDEFGLIIYDGKTYWVGEGRWDFFISHVSSDKASIATPLAEGLRSRGQRVWYDDLQIAANDDLGALIKFGIESSLFGVLIISRNFFGRRWTEAELDALQHRRIFLVLHDITLEELSQLLPG